MRFLFTRTGTILIPLVFMLLVALGSAYPARADSDWLARMPRVEDQTSMWWRDGFPGVVDGARWQRCIQTGNYGFILDTRTLQVPHFGMLSPDADLLQLPPAELLLSMDVAGKSYRCIAGGEWTRYTGPRLIESGRFFQRADVTDLKFVAEDGSQLKVEARLETAGWADRLALILAARPSVQPIPAGDACFGRVRGGFGLDGDNHFEIPAEPNLDLGKFTLEFWAFVPTDYQASETPPWLVCKNRNELADGNFGIVVRSGGVPQARLNLGGGREGAHVLEPDRKQSLNLDQWNHLALSYDDDTLRLYANGRMVGEKKIGQQRTPIAGAIAFGRRQDNSGDGYRSRGVVDEIRLYDRALTLEELRLHYVKPEAERPAFRPVGEWTFRDDIPASMSKIRESWEDAALEIAFASGKDELRQRLALVPGELDWQNVALAFDPVVFQAAPGRDEVVVLAAEIPSGGERPVTYDAALGWHRVNLDGIEPITPPGVEGPSNDAIERVKLTLSNPTDREQIARLMFEKTSRGIRQRIGTPITGISAILRDKNGEPTGIPVQLSKNWHNDAEGGIHSGQWFHGISQLRLPAGSTTELELTIAYGHWGGVPAASHAQLSLIGWGGNSLWEQSAIGSWGESICYDPDQAQANCTITDVRPLMVSSMGGDDKKLWGWTNNVGGGDFLRFVDPVGKRVPHSAMRTVYHRQGPCLTEVTHAGRLGQGATHSSTVSLARSDDVIRGSYRIRMDVSKPMDFSRFVIFQVGADSYNFTRERKLAVGDESGLLREWDAQWGGDTYQSEPVECSGRIPWVSLHEGAPPVGKDTSGAWANRGIVIRSWSARLGGKDAAPWISEYGLDMRSGGSSTIDILPPPDVMRLEAGDFVEATIEHIVIPQFADDYYGPSDALRSALTTDGNTWRMIFREAAGNEYKVKVTSGKLERTHPDVRILSIDDTAEFSLSGGLSYVPITFTGLTSPHGYQLSIDGESLDQSVHGKDFWQTEYDAASKTWSHTFNIPGAGDKTLDIRFAPTSASQNLREDQRP